MYFPTLCVFFYTSFMHGQLKQVSRLSILIQVSGSRGDKWLLHMISSEMGRVKLSLNVLFESFKMIWNGEILASALAIWEERNQWILFMILSLLLVLSRKNLGNFFILGTWVTYELWLQKAFLLLNIIRDWNSCASYLFSQLSSAGWHTNCLPIPGN